MNPTGDTTGKVDLHSHSTASDGGLTPTALAAEAVKVGLAGLALTDHDTVDGLPEFFAAARDRDLSVVGGVEISLEHSGTMHLLGLNVTGGPEVPAALGRLKVFRVERNLKILDLLGSQGYYLSWEKLQNISGGGQIGRPHFAALLLEKGYFKTREDVFDKLLGKGRPGYVNKVRLSPEDGLAMVREAGWAPVLAHPVSLGLEPGLWPPFLARLVDGGLLGLEVHHPSHGPEQAAFFQKMARQFNLTATSGSDFHGVHKPAIGLDWVRQNSPLDWQMVENLRSKLGQAAA